MSEFRSIGFAPLTCAVLGGVLTLGTVVGQHGSAPADAGAGPMAGMDHSAMAGMDHSKMAGMTHVATPGMDPAMPGMDHPAPGTGATAPAMNMSAPGMAAAMPGGFHATCTGRSVCTVLFSRGATGTASVLGARARLQKLTPSAVRVLVNDKPVVLRPGKPARAHGLSISLVTADSKEASLRFRKAH